MLGLVSAKNMFSRMVRAGSLLSVLLMFGCSSSEMLVKIPSNSDGATIAPYDTSTFKNNIDLFSPLSLERKIDQLKLLQRTEKLFVLFDNSDSMQDNYRGISRYDYGLEILDRFHRTLPNMTLQGNVFITSAYINTFFLSRILSGDNNQDEFSWAIEPYDPDIMQERAKDTTQSFVAGDGSLHSAIYEMSDLIAYTNEPAALLLVTHWERIDKKALTAIAHLRQRIKMQHDKELCVYTIGVGNNYSRARFDQSDTCGTSVAADKIAQPRDMLHFIERMFFFGPADTDNDGIYDYRDKCPDTEQGRLVRFDGCKRFDSADLSNDVLKKPLDKSRFIVSNW